MELFDTSHTLYPVHKTFSAISLSAAGSSTVMSKLSLLNRKYTKNRFEVVETDLYAGADMEKFKFAYTSTGMATTNTLVISLEDLGSDIYGPKTAANAAFL